jgi:hypothetical protein
VNWHPRRHLPAYAEAFIADVAAYAARTYPGREFARVAPPPAPESTGAPGAVQNRAS